MYERLVDAIDRDDSDIAACGVQMIWEDDPSKKILVQTEDCILNRGAAQKALLKETILKQPVWYKIYKRDLIKDIAFEVGRDHEDVFWSYRAIGAAKRVSLINYIGYFYYQREGSIMSASYSLKRLDALAAFCERYEYIKKEFPELTDSALTAIWSRCIYEGQQALLYLPKEEIVIAYRIIRETQSRYPIKKRNYVGESSSRKIWISLSRISLMATCMVRNILKKGT